MVVIPDVRPAAIAFGDERGRIVTLPPPTNHRPTKIKVIVAIMIAMAKRPSDRYPTYDDLIMALTAARSQLLVHKFRHPGPSGGSTGGKSWWKR